MGENPVKLHDLGYTPIFGHPQLVAQLEDWRIPRKFLGEKLADWLGKMVFRFLIWPWISCLDSMLDFGVAQQFKQKGFVRP